MILRLISAFVLAFLVGCAVHETYSDTTNVGERKAYIACAVTRAFTNPNHGLSPEDTARLAIGKCANERDAVYTKLIAENAGKPFSMRFIQAYMDELHQVMLDHIALRLSQARAPASDTSGI
jgi:hypothetical protein